MTTEDILRSVLAFKVDNAVYLFTNGYISRQAYGIADSAKNFYLIGSMGLVSSLGLGIAMNSKKKVVVLDGDGSILMNMGTMPLIGYIEPNNLIHFILDNFAYHSTGNQPTISENIDFLKMACACGYKKVFRFKKISEFKSALPEIFNACGPVFVHMVIGKNDSSAGPRVGLAPLMLARRIRKTIRSL
ncbi:MAG: thiamine pyrophosphate-dependent enzyme [Candidatus Omnitrophota bacterium]|nr:thiamine pyrophosphate-dependent enzyme [Candidatus Omnitrophota bacterium]